jgi:hypothetical protein
MTKAERKRKIEFLRQVEAGIVTIKDLKSTCAVVIVTGDIHGDKANNIYHINGTDLDLSYDEYLLYTAGMTAVCLLPAKIPHPDDI